MIINDNIPYIQKVHNDVITSINPVSNVLVSLHSESSYRHDKLFLIQVENAHAISAEIINQIPADILTRIYSKEVILAILGAAEAFHGKYLHIDNIYEHLINYHSIPESQILFIGGSLDLKDYVLNLSKERNKDVIKLEYYASYINYMRKYFEELYSSNGSLFKSITKKSTVKKYIMLSRVCRPHRVAILSLLNNRKILDQGYVSFLARKEEWDSVYSECIKVYKEISDEIIKGSDIKEKIPLSLDHEDPRKILYSWNILKYFNQSYFSLIIETLYDHQYPRFLTEKTFKSILYKHPFIMVSRHDSLSMLRFLGFKTFHPLINEEYDLEINDSKRLSMIVDEVERLCNLSESELNIFKEKALEIVEFNYNHLMTTNKLLYKLL